MESKFVWEDSGADDDGDERRKGPWTQEEDSKLISFVSFYGDGRWDALAKASGLKRSGKSCRLRWVNYLRPDLKRSRITQDEERLIIDLHRRFGNRWSRIAQQLPGRTDNEIKNYFRTHIRKKINPEFKEGSEGTVVDLTEAIAGADMGPSSESKKPIIELCEDDIKLSLAPQTSAEIQHYDRVCSMEEPCLEYYGECKHVSNVFMDIVGFPNLNKEPVSSTMEDASDGDTFVDYSDKLWDISHASNGFISKSDISSVL